MFGLIFLATADSIFTQKLEKHVLTSFSLVSNALGRQISLYLVIGIQLDEGFINQHI